MASNDFSPLPYAIGAGANVETQANWLTDGRTSQGVVAGIASSSHQNKLARQLSYGTAAIAYIISTLGGINCPDDGNLANFVTNFLTALSIAGVGRIQLKANTSFYFTPGGTGNGLTSGTPSGNLQTLLDYIGLTYDIGNSTVTVHWINGGTYGASVTLNGRFVMGIEGAIVIQADSAATWNGALTLLGGAQLTIQGPITWANSSGNALNVQFGSYVQIGAGIIFGICSSYQIYIASGATVRINGNIAVAGSAPNFAYLDGGYLYNVSGITISINSSPTFSGGFIQSQDNGVASIPGITFSGAATGPRFAVLRGGGIYTGTAGSGTYLPGNAAGTLDGTNYTGSANFGAVASWYI